MVKAGSGSIIWPRPVSITSEMKCDRLKGGVVEEVRTMICPATLLVARKTKKPIEKRSESYMYTLATSNASMNCLPLFTYVCSYGYSILLYIPCLYLCFYRLLNVC